MSRAFLLRPLFRKTLGLSGSLALLTVLAPGPVNAQTPADLVRQFAETASGFTLRGDIEVGALPAGRQISFPLSLTGGQDYMMVGFCDNDCEDMDLVLLDGSGTELESDYLVDAQPVLVYTPGSSGVYNIRLDMVTCTIEPCNYAVGIFEGDLGNEFGLAGADMSERMEVFREEMSSQGYTEMGSPERGALNSDQEIRFPVRLLAGMDYQVLGVCDNDCEDMDLIIYDPSGQTVDSDVLTDAVPMLELTASVSGEYRIAALMITCTVEPCGYLVSTFVRGDGMAPGGIAVSGTIVSEATHRGALEPGDDQLREGEYFDEYTIQAEAGQRVIVDLRSPDFDTYLILEAPGGESERNDDYEGDTMHSHVEMVATRGGTFSILVTTFSAESIGDYTLQVAVVEGS